MVASVISYSIGWGVSGPCIFTNMLFPAHISTFCAQTGYQSGNLCLWVPTAGCFLSEVYLRSIEYLFWVRSMARSTPLVKSTPNLMLSVRNYRTASIILQGVLWAPPQKGALFLSHHDLFSPTPSLVGVERWEDEGLVSSHLGSNEQGRGSWALPTYPLSRSSFWINKLCSALLYKDYLVM